MKIEDLCLKTINEFFINVDTTTLTEKIHYTLGILSLAKRLDPHNKAIDNMFAQITEKIEVMNTKADFLEYFYLLLDEMTNGNADSVGSMHIELEGHRNNARQELITIDYKSEPIDD